MVITYGHQKARKMPEMQEPNDCDEVQARESLLKVLLSVLQGDRVSDT